MQVSQVDDQISHVVIGANQTKAMKFADTAELFNTFSSTLYSNGDRAAVREVMCNGWDSHIESGCTDKPLIVKFEAKGSYISLSFKDSGKGIHPDLVEGLYGTYGGTTKTMDGRQTGGFGLGCKAPFAIVDDFEMISCFEGQKTIYRISKSSGAVAGLPGITPIMTIPCGEESGVEVKINIPMSKLNLFKNEVKRTAFLGQISTTITISDSFGLSETEELQMLDYGSTKYNYLVTGEAYLDSRISVRLGNVVYPVDDHADFNGRYDNVTSILKLLRGYSSYGTSEFSVIFNAPPSSLSITPSREVLKMSEHTIKTMNELFDEFINAFKQEYKKQSDVIVDELVVDAFHKMRPNMLLTRPNRDLLHIIRGSSSRDKKLNTNASPKDLASKAIHNNYPTDHDFCKRELISRVKAMIEFTPQTKRGKMQSMLKALIQEKDLERWFTQEIMAPLISKLDADTEMSSGKLYVRGTTDYRPPYDKVKNVYPHIPHDRQFHPWNQWKKHDSSNYVNFLRNFVVLAYSREAVTNRLANMPAMRHWFDSTENCFVYLVQRSERKAEAARKFFEKNGFYIVDLTKHYAWDPKAAKEASEKPKPPRKKGLPSLANGVGTYGFDSPAVFAGNANRIENFQFITRLPEGRIPNMNGTETWLTAQLFGADTGVVVSVVQEEKYLREGAVLLTDHVQKILPEEITNNPDILKVHAYDLNRLTEFSSEKRNLIAAILTDPVLSTYYNLQPVVINQRASLFLRLWAQRYYNMAAKDAAADKLLKSTPLHPDVTDMANRIEHSSLLEVLDIGPLIKNLSDPQVPEFNKTRIRDILIHILKG